MKNQFRFTSPPPPLRRAHLDNIGLVPANLLPQVQRWHRFAGGVKDELVIVLPKTDSIQRKTLTTVAKMLKNLGHHVRIVTEQELPPPRFGTMVQETLDL